MDLVSINEQIREKSLFIDNIRNEVAKVIVGQKNTYTGSDTMIKVKVKFSFIFVNRMTDQN